MTGELDDSIAERLLDLLRRRTGADALGYATRPERIRGGFDTHVFGFELRDPPPPLTGPLILRLHRIDTDPVRARLEATLHGALANLGYPCPPVHLVGGPEDGLGAAYLVMPRVPGRVMLDALMGPGMVRMPAMLARLQLALHALDPTPVRRALVDAGFDPARFTVEHELDTAAREIDRARLDGLRGALDWLRAHRPTEPPQVAVCQGDFHPVNVLVDHGQPTGVIDWSDHLRFADPAYDVGVTIALVRHGPLDMVPLALRGMAALGRWWIIDAYSRAYLGERPLDRMRLRYYEALREMVLLIEAGVELRARAGVIAPLTKRSAFGSTAQIRRVSRRFHAISGVAPHLELTSVVGTAKEGP